MTAPRRDPNAWRPPAAELRRLSRLAAYVQTVGVYSDGETAAALRDARRARRPGWEAAGRFGGSEAVYLTGGPLALVRRAIRERHYWRRARGPERLAAAAARIRAEYARA